MGEKMTFGTVGSGRELITSGPDDLDGEELPLASNWQSSVGSQPCRLPCTQFTVSSLSSTRRCAEQLKPQKKRGARSSRHGSSMCDAC